VFLKRLANGREEFLKPEWGSQEALGTVVVRSGQGGLIVTDRQDRDGGVGCCQRLHEPYRLFRVRIENNDSQVRRCEFNAVGESLVTRALDIKPHEIDVEQHRSECFSGRFRRVYDRNALHS